MKPQLTLAASVLILIGCVSTSKERFQIKESATMSAQQQQRIDELKKDLDFIHKINLALFISCFAVPLTIGLVVQANK